MSVVVCMHLYVHFQKLALNIGWVERLEGSFTFIEMFSLEPEFHEGKAMAWQGFDSLGLISID